MMTQTMVVVFDHLDGTDYIFKEDLTDREIRVPRVLLPEAVAEVCENFRQDMKEGLGFELTFKGPI